MAVKLISQILKEISEIKGRKAKVEALQEQGNNSALKAVLQAAFDERIIFELPEGTPPYNVPEDMMDNTAGLYQGYKKFYIFTKNQKSAQIKQMQRENVFIQLLESLPPEEAELVLAMKDKKIPYKGITKKLAQEAFPDFIQ